MDFSKNIAVQRLVLPEVKDIKIFGNIKKIRKSKLAFTLAETLIVVSMLGVVAAITLPSMYSKHTERVNIVKIKKAMAIYDSALRRMKAEHSLNTETAFNNWINEKANCANPSNYFVKSDGNGCIFRTQEGLWWNITNINNPLVAFDRDDLDGEIANDSDDYRAFYFINDFDDKFRLRTNDLSFETGDAKDQLIKLYEYIGFKIEKSPVVCDTQGCCANNTGSRCTETVSRDCNDNTISNCVDTYKYDEDGNLLYRIEQYHNVSAYGIGHVGSDFTWILDVDNSYGPMIQIVDKGDGKMHYWDRSCDNNSYNCVEEMDVDANGNITSLHIRSSQYGNKKYYSASSIPFEINCTKVPCSTEGTTWTQNPSSGIVAVHPEYQNYYNDLMNE